jgi:hypothetical protein
MPSGSLVIRGVLAGALFPSMLRACSGILPRICCCRAMFAFPMRTKTSGRSIPKRDRTGLRMPIYFEVYFCDIGKLKFDVNYVSAGQTTETFLSLLEASPWSPLASSSFLAPSPL